jgi:hypothetical protein
VFLVAFLRDVVSQGNYNRWGETDALVTLSAGEDDVGFVLSCVFVLIFYVWYTLRSTPASLSAFLVQAITPTTLDPEISREERSRRELKQMYMQKVVRYFLTTTIL